MVTIGDLIKDKDYDYIEYRCTAPDNWYEEDIFFGICKSENGKLIALDGDTYYEGDHIVRYEDVDGDNTFDYDIGDAYEVIPDTVGQFVGRYDVDGKKIFTGDIVESCGERFIIESNDPNDVFNFADVALMNLDAYRLYVGNAEVIGNIYDNPDMLREEV